MSPCASTRVPVDVQTADVPTGRARPVGTLGTHGHRSRTPAEWMSTRAPAVRGQCGRECLSDPQRAEHVVRQQSSTAVDQATETAIGEPPLPIHRLVRVLSLHRLVGNDMLALGALIPTAPPPPQESALAQPVDGNH